MKAAAVARGCPLGTHRVLEPAGAMPQEAWRLDNTPEVGENEMDAFKGLASANSAALVRAFIRALPSSE